MVLLPIAVMISTMAMMIITKVVVTVTKRKTMLVATKRTMTTRMMKRTMRMSMRLEAAWLQAQDFPIAKCTTAGVTCRLEGIHGYGRYHTVCSLCCIAKSNPNPIVPRSSHCGASRAVLGSQKLCPKAQKNQCSPNNDDSI